MQIRKEIQNLEATQTINRKNIFRRAHHLAKQGAWGTYSDRLKEALKQCYKERKAWVLKSVKELTTLYAMLSDMYTPKRFYNENSLDASKYYNIASGGYTGD